VDQAIDFGRGLLARHAGIVQPTTFTMLELEWDLLPGVFAPVFTGASSLFASWVPYPVGGAFLDMGCGMGMVAVCAARAGCASVTAVDIDGQAVANTARNALRHGVDDRLRAVRSDLFAALPGQRFDMIFWNSNFVEVDEDYPFTVPLEHALFDPGYATHRRFLAGARHHLRPGGRLLLGFSSMGRVERIEEVAGELGYRTGVLVEEVREVPHPVRYLLLEFTDTRPSTMDG
jgi:release factor glutamine methyltransferase